mgnify:CR=1 FL=1
MNLLFRPGVERGQEEEAAEEGLDQPSARRGDSIQYVQNVVFGYKADNKNF